MKTSTLLPKTEGLSKFSNMGPGKKSSRDMEEDEDPIIPAEEDEDDDFDLPIDEDIDDFNEFDVEDEDDDF